MKPEAIQPILSRTLTVSYKDLLHGFAATCVASKIILTILRPHTFLIMLAVTFTSFYVFEPLLNFVRTLQGEYTRNIHPNVDSSIVSLDNIHLRRNKKDSGRSLPANHELFGDSNIISFPANNAPQSTKH